MGHGGPCINSTESHPEVSNCLSRIPTNHPKHLLIIPFNEEATGHLGRTSAVAGERDGVRWVRHSILSPQENFRWNYL